MSNLIIEHDVNDFNTWKKNYDAHRDVRARHHVKNDRVYQMAGDPNHVCVICDGEPQHLQAFIKDPALKAAMKEGGVVGEPKMQIVERASATTTV